MTTNIRSRLHRQSASAVLLLAFVAASSNAAEATSTADAAAAADDDDGHGHGRIAIEVRNDYLLGVGDSRRHENSVPVNYGGRHPFEILEEERRRRRRRRETRKRRRRRRRRAQDEEENVGDGNEEDDGSGGGGEDGGDGSGDDGDGEGDGDDGGGGENGGEVEDSGGADDEEGGSEEDDGDGGRWGEHSTSSYMPLRIDIRTEGLQSSPSADPDRAARLNFLTETVLPQAAQFWSSALRVFPVDEGGIRVEDNECFRLPNGSVEHDDADLVVVAVEDARYCGGGGGDGGGTPSSPGGASSTPSGGGAGNRNAGLTRLAGGSNCQQDQYDRPTVGLLFICPDTIDVSTEKTRSLFFDTVVHEFAHILGFMWADFAYYYDRTTGLPLTPDREKRTFNCVDGVQRDVVVPSSDTVLEIQNDRGVRHFEIVTPTVRNVVRNHFACPDMYGARLENQPTIANDCFGSHWDEVLYSSELLSSVSTTAQQYLSPLTLALFEDTGWYVADYSVSSISPFGHGLGCSFVAGPCVVDGQVPPASRGVFCGPSEPEIGCSPDHRMVAACDLVVYNQDLPKKFRYFDDAKVGGGLAQLDYCPAYLRESFLFPSGLRSHLDCTDSSLQGATFASPSETFGPTSRCIETGYSRPYCFRTNCDAERHLVEITVRTSNGEFNVECPEAGRTVTVPWILDLEIRCPSLARICPDLVCPAHCSGRGVCDWTLDDPECRCNDDADDSPICANSPTVTIMSPTVSPRPTRTPVVSETDPPASAPVSQEARSSGFRHCRQRRELVSWTRWEEAAMGLVIWSAPLWALLF